MDYSTLETFYDKTPVRRGTTWNKSIDAGNSKCNKINAKKGPRRIKRS